VEKIRIGGVPEHFNLPVHLAMESGKFQKEGIEVEWIDYPGGTGQMAKALEEGSCDLCMVLTEGIIAAITKGNPSRIISGYVKSPLIWGVHTGIHNPLDSHERMFEQRIAISRVGSGSHLMPSVDALLKGKTLSKEQFVAVQDINGAIESLNKGETDIFYWEKYTTKPYVEKGLLKRIGEFVTPWPCFVIAASEAYITAHSHVLRKVLQIIHSACDEFMKNPEAPNLVSERYGMHLTDAAFWFHATEWSSHSWVSDKMLQSVVFTLMQAGLLPEGSTTKGLVWEKV
jgi:sulfonate transport system substrate-binding protein